MKKEIMTIEKFTGIVRAKLDNGKEKLTDDEIFVMYHRRKLPSWVLGAEDRGCKVSLSLKLNLINQKLGGYLEEK